MKTPHIAIVVLHYKNLDDTRDCLLSLKKIDYSDFSVILVNNDFSEDARILLDEFGDFIKIIQNKENLGFSEGNNVGIRTALEDERTNAVLLLNNDVTVEPDFLSELVSVLDHADMIAPRMMRSDHHDQVDNLGLVLMSSGLPFNRRTENEKLFCPSGGCALYTRKLLEEVRARHVLPLHNYFDPLFFAYCEDLDLGWRARLAGFNCAYAPKAIVYHKGSAVTSKMSDFAVYHTYRNLLWTQFKNLPLPLLLWQSPWLGAGWLALLVLYTFKKRPKVIIDAIKDGILGLRFIWKRRSVIKKSNKEILSWFASGLFPKSYL